MKVVTCVSDRQHYGYKTFLEASCKYFGLKLITLEHEGTWTSHRMKDIHLLECVKTLPRNEIVLFTDGYDTMLLASEEELIEKFRRFQKPLVFTAEKNCWPFRLLADQYPDSPTPFRFLNSGGFVGEAGIIADLLRKYAAPPSSYSPIRKAVWNFRGFLARREMNPDRLYRWSNQYYWTHIFLRSQDQIALDYHAEIFLELSTGLNAEKLRQFKADGENSEIYRHEKMRLTRDCIIREKRVWCGNTESKPCHIHFNGPIVRHIAFSGHFAEAMPWLNP